MDLPPPAARRTRLAATNKGADMSIRPFIRIALPYGLSVVVILSIKIAES